MKSVVTKTLLILAGLLAVVEEYPLVEACRAQVSSAATLDSPSGPGNASIQSQVRRILEQRKSRDRQIWSLERMAQKHEAFFVDLWDRLREDPSQAVELLGKPPIDRITLPQLGEPVLLDYGVELREGGPGLKRTLSEWRHLLKQWTENGWAMVQCEWHHRSFQTGADGTARSTVHFTWHVTNTRQNQNAIVDGEFAVTWQPIANATEPSVPRVVDTVKVRVMTRPRAPSYRRIHRHQIALPQRMNPERYPILVYDLDDDALVDILFPAGNVLLRNHGDGQFGREAISQDMFREVRTAVVADFNGDGAPDLAAVGRNRENSPRMVGLYLGDGEGGFRPGVTEFPIPGAVGSQPLVCAGDADSDGYPDLWIVQYLPPYVGGNMPTPYYDANDGLPAYLLVNRDRGHEFVDVTDAAGLGAKRFRRTYSTSFYDMDDDGDQDLIVVNDFCGVDVYRNDGKGHFHDITGDAVDHPRLFGMSHVLADFNVDGRCDLYVTGMASTTARRLEAMGAAPEQFPEHNRMRMEMAYGNRVYLADDRGRFRQPAWKDTLARAGWAWGVAAFDMDNDGDLEVYVNNGNYSGETAQDYCTTFWCHDIYSGTSGFSPVWNEVYRAVYQSGVSWNGFEKNCLFLNTDARGFLNAAFLFDVALEADSRGLVATDLDNDGRTDLILNAKRNGHWGVEFWRNELDTDNHWLGVQLHESRLRRSPLGAKVVLFAGGKQRAAAIVSGDSYCAQHPAAVHFGLGRLDQVDAVEVRQGGKTVVRIENPPIDRVLRLPEPPPSR